MVDHHVDRPGVEVRQRMQLTGTNRSFGFNTLIYNARLNRPASLGTPAPGPDANPSSHVVLRRPGGHGEGPVPDPIPNSAVKPLRANGTLSQDTGE